MYKPLLPSGIKDISLGELDSLFLKPFGINPIRKRLLANLRRYLTKLQKIGIPFEVWIDGSFVTNKPEPNDIDLVIGVHKGDIAALLASQLELLEGLTYKRKRINLQYGIDVYVVNLESEPERQKWISNFSIGASKEEQKGIFRIKFDANVEH